MTLSTFLSTPSIRLFCVESFSPTACRMTEVCSVSSFSICGMINDRPLGCLVVDFDMKGGIMARTFKYRCVVEAVNGMEGRRVGRQESCGFQIRKRKLE